MQAKKKSAAPCTLNYNQTNLSTNFRQISSDQKPMSDVYPSNESNYRSMKQNFKTVSSSSGLFHTQFINDSHENNSDFH